jgi:hypothetical protein
LIDGAINQDPVWPMTSLKLAADEVLLAVADMGGTSNAPGRVGRTVLDELAKEVWEHLEWLQGGFVANRNLCHMQAKVFEQLADNLK